MRFRCEHSDRDADADRVATTCVPETIADALFKYARRLMDFYCWAKKVNRRKYGTATTLSLLRNYRYKRYL